MHKNTLLAAVLGIGVVVGSAAAQKAGKGAGKKPPPPAAAKKVDVDAAAKTLVGGDTEAAVKAAGELGDSKDAAAHEALLDAIAVGLDPEVAQATVSAIARHPKDTDGATLAFYARYRDPEVRAAAAEALGQYDSAVTQRALIAALGDEELAVRAAAAKGAGEGRVKATTKALMALLIKGDKPAAPALALIADAELARVIGEQLGVAPDDLLAECLGGILLRSDFGPDSARVEVVRAIAKIKGDAATKALQDYVDETPEKPPRQSRKEAKSIIGERTGG
jgi:HEAT repeat protein